MASQENDAPVDVIPETKILGGKSGVKEQGNVSSSDRRRPRHKCISSMTDDADIEDESNNFTESSRLISYRSEELEHSINNSEIGHCHDRLTKTEMDKRARNKLITASLLCLVFMTAEAVGGILAGSLAIISDAAHLLTDFASFLISLLALYLGTRPATKKLSFGWYRAEILGALLSILVLWVLTGILCYSATERIIRQHYSIDAEIMLITAAVGVAFNLTLGLILHQHSHSLGSHTHSHNVTPSAETSINYGSMAENGRVTSPVKRQESKNINVTAAFIHVLGDFVQSIGVLVAAFIIYFKPQYKIADPICTFVFSVFVIVTTFTVVRDILVILMEGTPRNLNFSEIRKTFYEIEGVKDIHNLRVWSLTLNKTALSVHLAIEKDYNPLLLISQASELIKEKFGITDTTVQIEEYVDEMLDCTRCQDLKD